MIYDRKDTDSERAYLLNYIGGKEGFCRGFIHNVGIDQWKFRALLQRQKRNLPQRKIGFPNAGRITSDLIETIHNEFGLHLPLLFQMGWRRGGGEKKISTVQNEH